MLHIAYDSCLDSVSPPEREFNPDVHCGVMDVGARKQCTRSLTCKVSPTQLFFVCQKCPNIFLKCSPLVIRINDTNLEIVLPMQTHSLSQRRAVSGRRKRFDVLLAEHKNRARDKELNQQQHKAEPSQQTPPPLREPHPPPHHGNPTVAATDAAKLFPLKAKPHNPVLPR